MPQMQYIFLASVIQLEILVGVLVNAPDAG